LPYQREEQAQLNQLVRQAALALGYTTTIAELQGLNTELEQRVALRATQLLGQQRALAALAERQRLARDLHDSVTQALFSMHLSARAIRRMVGRDPQAAEQALTEQEDAARQALAEMRNLLAQLRAEPEPSSTAMRDLAADIAAHCASLAQRGELEVTIHVPTTLFLPTLQAEGLFQITREALHNVSKHSGVKTATCMLQVSEGCVLLNIRDHGQGFVLGQHAIGRYGLQGMHERAAELGAILRIDAQPGAGVCIEVQLAAVPTNLAA
jgi:signal transduction histidine kinase